MPRQRRGRPAQLRARAGALVAAMEFPLHRARGLADALDYVGYGLENLKHEGARPVLTLAGALMEDLDSLHASWLALATTFNDA